MDHQMDRHVPEGVENFEQYEKYLRLREHPLLNDKRIIQVKDSDIQIDLMASTVYVEKVVMDLDISKIEKNRIIALSKCTRSILGKVSHAKRLAYGSRRAKGYYNQKEILEPKAAEIIEMFGRYYTIGEVHRIVTQEWGIDISHRAVREFKVRNLDKITKLQEEYQKSYSDLRLSHKRGRLDELVWMYKERKDEYFKNNRSRDDQKELRGILEQIRKEVEVDKLLIEGDINVNIEATITQHIQKEVLTNLSLLDIIVARIAAKRNINPQAFIYQLHNSYYNKYNGINGIEGEEFNNDKIYPSSLIYDLDGMKQKSIDKSQEVKDIEHKPVFKSNGKENNASKLRELLKQKLTEKQVDLNRSVDRISRRQESSDQDDKQD